MEQSSNQCGMNLFEGVFGTASNLPVNYKAKVQSANVIKAVSKAVAKTNKPHFHKKLQDEFSKRDMDAELK